MFTKKNLTVMFVCLATYWTAAPFVSAHVLQTDGSIGAILHTDPEDNPIASQPTSFFLEFADKDHRFELGQCSCAVVITQRGEQVFSQTLSEFTFSYTFPQPDVFTLTVVGQPKTAGAFQPFRLTYDLTVQQAPPAAEASGATFPQSKFGRFLLQGHVIHVVIFGGGFITLGILYLKDKYKAKKATAVKS